MLAPPSSGILEKCEVMVRDEGGGQEMSLEQSGEGGRARGRVQGVGVGELRVVWALDIVLRTRASLRDGGPGAGRGLGCQAEGIELRLQVLGSPGKLWAVMPPQQWQKEFHVRQCPQ